MKTESTNLVKSQPAKRNTQFWKNVMIGGVPGILIGAAGTGLATAASATTPVVDPVEPSPAELSPLPIAEVSDDMSFGEAFAAAREQVGAGGVFEWRGNVYNTYSEEEWGAMSPEDRAEFADRLSVTPIEIEEEVTPEVQEVVPEEPVETEPEEPVETEPEEDVNAGNGTDVEHDEEVVGEVVDVQIEEVGVVEMEDGSEAVMAVGQMDGHTALLADVDNDGVFDVMAVDNNDNDVAEESELIDISEDNITVDDAVLLAQNNIADDPSAELYAGTPDYVNDADTSAFA